MGEADIEFEIDDDGNITINLEAPPEAVELVRALNPAAVAAWEDAHAPRVLFGNGKYLCG